MMSSPNSESTRKLSVSADYVNQSQRSPVTGPLSATKKFLGYLNIEPLAFLAILALYIEFPSIQDLIYTKICLQVLAGHPNLTQPHQVPPLLLRQPIEISVSGGSQASTSTDAQAQPQELGRIQEATRPVINNVVAPTTNDFQMNTDISLCDRFNKSAIPKDVVSEIMDANSVFWLKYQLIICFLCTVSSPYWGGMSDKIGRLIPMNIPIVTSVISNLISLIVGLLISLNLHSIVNTNWLYLGATMIGLSGGQAVVIVNSFSFISDNTSSESRTKRVVLLESIIYLSHSVGFYITKQIWSVKIATETYPWFNRHFVAFLCCIVLNLICVLYSILRLRHHKFHKFMNNFEREQQETLAGNTPTASSSNIMSQAHTETEVKTVAAMHTGGDSNLADRPRELTASTPDDLDGPIVKSDKRLTNWRNILTLSYYKQTYLTATKQRETRSIILLLLLCGFISAMCLVIQLSLLFIYLHMEPFNWDTKAYSWWNSVTSITRGLALVSLTASMKFIKGWNVPDPLVAAVGFLSKGIGLLMIATAQSSLLVNWSLLALVLSEFTMPPIRSLLSKLVVTEEVGKIYSCLSAIQSVCFLSGNIIFYLGLNSLELQDFYRLSFLIVAGAQFGAVIIMILVYSNLRSRMILV